MNLWIIGAIIVGVLVIAGVMVANISSVQADEPEQKQCSSCGNSCTADSNCGLKTCGAVNGGSCNCGK